MTYTASRRDLLASAAALFEVVRAGAVRVEVNQTYALRDAARAHSDLEGRNDGVHRSAPASAAPGLLERLRRRLAQRLWWLPFGRVPEVTAGSLAAELNNGGRPQLLDVRTAHEFREGHVDGAVNVPVSELHRHLDRLRLQPGGRWWRSA